MKTPIADARTEGFDFLGYHFSGSEHRVRPKSAATLRFESETPSAY